MRTASPPDAAPPIRLVVASGPAEGRSLPIRDARFVIGRDADCQLRIGSPRVSRHHASIEMRGGRAFLRDLGSTNGTTLNDRLLRDEQAPLAVGDRIEVGPLRLEVAADRGGEVPPRPEDLIVGWLRDESPTAEFPASTLPPIEDETPEPGEPIPLDGEAADDSLRCTSIEGVAVITPRRSHLDDETSVGPLRAAFQALYERPMPRRVVLNLTNVLHLSSRAIAAIVAHNLRLRHAGGELRLCQVRPRLLSSLELVRLPMLVQLYPTLDDAVLTEWP